MQPKSITTSIRIDPDALAVLEWKANLDGIPLRSTLRNELETRAAQISAQYNLPPKPADHPAITIHDLKTTEHD